MSIIYNSSSFKGVLGGLRVCLFCPLLPEATPQNKKLYDAETVPATDSQVEDALSVPSGSKGSPAPTSPSTSELTSVSKNQDDAL